MVEIPKYIVRKIERHNDLVERAAKLEAEIDEWYTKQLEKHEDIISEFRDEDFADIKCDIMATYVSLENMLYNLSLIEN